MALSCSSTQVMRPVSPNPPIVARNQSGFSADEHRRLQLLTGRDVEDKLPLHVGEPEDGIVVVSDDAEQPLEVALADRDQPRAAMRIAKWPVDRERSPYSELP